jgi:hypothetical protein
VCVSALAAVVFLGWVLFLPCESESSSSTAGTSGKVHIVEKRHFSPMSLDFDSLRDKRLQGRPTSTPIENMLPKPEPVKNQPAPPSFRLLGTMIEGERSLALVSTAAGKSSFKGIGELFGSGNEKAEVVEIHSESVVLRILGQLYTIQLERAKKG